MCFNDQVLSLADSIIDSILPIYRQPYTLGGHNVSLEYITVTAIRLLLLFCPNFSSLENLQKNVTLQKLQKLPECAKNWRWSGPYLPLVWPKQVVVNGLCTPVSIRVLELKNAAINTTLSCSGLSTLSILETSNGLESWHFRPYFF